MSQRRDTRRIMPMEYAMALPQGGRGAHPDAVRQVATLAEALGYSHLWANDHILASLDAMTGGRVLASFGVGWSELEFKALSSSFSDRGVRMEEMVEIIRTAWSEDYVAFETPHYSLPPVKIAPKPVHPIPIWISGTSERAYDRATRIGDGYHGHAVQDILADNVADKVARLRRDRPEESFTFSVYTWEWDLTRRSEEEILAERAAYADAGVQHVVIALDTADLDTRLTNIGRLAELCEIAPR
jgi:alkanesulfonate monooxygenase SsuD/methylene tetrahydromethanopterin reductase-like flavin-dependent oxidoreductase (luciferase family)